MTKAPIEIPIITIKRGIRSATRVPAQPTIAVILASVIVMIVNKGNIFKDEELRRAKKILAKTLPFVAHLLYAVRSVFLWIPLTATSLILFHPQGGRNSYLVRTNPITWRTSQKPRGKPIAKNHKA